MPGTNGKDGLPVQREDNQHEADQPQDGTTSNVTLPEITFSQSDVFQDALSAKTPDGSNLLDSAHIKTTLRETQHSLANIKHRQSDPPENLPLGLTAAQRLQLQRIKFKVTALEEIHDYLLTVADNINDTSVEELEGQEKLVYEEWEELLTLQDKVIECLSLDPESVNDDPFQRASRRKRDCVALIYRLKGLVKKRIGESTVPAPPPQANQLRKIGLQPFSGDITKWKQFSDLFKSMVGNTTLSETEKLHRLKEALRGKAADLISTFTVVEGNYEKAWSKLERKYEDPRLIAQALFNRVLTLPKINKATADNLNANTSTVTETLDQLVLMTGLSKDAIAEQMFAHLLRRSLDSETLKAWELKLGESRDFPSLKEFAAFVDSCARGVNAGTNLELNIIESPKSSTPKKKKHVHVAATQHKDDEQSTKTLPSQNCAYCKGSHFIGSCQEFINLAPHQRNDFVVSKRLCFNCLGPHVATKCKSTKTCFECRRRHHTLIHGGSSYTGGSFSTFDPTASSTAPTPAIDKQPRASTAVVNLNNQLINETKEKINNRDHQSEADQQMVLLATVQAKIKSPKGFSLNARILIDQGSEVSFISDQLVQQLHLKRRSSTIELIGIGEISSGDTRGVVTVILQSEDGSNEVQINAHILKRLTARLPSFSCSSADIGSLEDLQLADPNYLQPGQIDVIIGADNYGRIIENQVVKSRNSQLVGQQTVFGWILSGPINCKGCSAKNSLTAVRNSPNEQLLELLQKFWVQEELPIRKSKDSELSPDELECEMHFNATHSRDESGRYIVRLPLRTSTAALGDSKFKASRQLQSVVRRLKLNESYAQLYREFIKEYETLGHMKEAPDSPEPIPAYYLPHHGVLRTDAITTKLRVVFNGSSQSSSGVSLNDILYPGGKLQVDAMNVLTWLRKHKLVFGTDIVKMFRQIQVHQDDWDLQRILWSNEENQLITYQLTTVTYGLNCSPWLSLRVLQQLADDEGHRYPAAVEALTKGRYVDDIYGGAESAEHLKEIAWQLQGLCNAGGFPLQKWSSNCPEALHELGLSIENSVVQFEESIIKVLGLCWHQSTDTFRYKSKQFTSATFTKRSLLSEIAQIFDPLGFIAPVVIRGKILIQNLWRLKLNWDDQLPLEYVRQWRTFRDDIKELGQVSVPRWLKLSSKVSSIQIHGFADASTAAMSAVVYIRTKKFNEPASTVLVCAKTRVAPIKKMSIPRLELTAALLLTQLVAATHQMLELDHVETHLWSDSAVALAWIRSHPSRWKEFVHNRVAKIQETLPTATWRHVSGKDNAADCASRGISTTQLVNHQLWWSGPEWINDEPEHWPQSSIDTPSEVSLEAKPLPAHPVAINVNALAELLNRYSTLSKVLQVTATLNRAIDRFKRQPTPQSPVLTTKELNEARQFWVKITQYQYFASAHRILQRDHQLPRSHPLAVLTPTLDHENIIRVGGRLKNSMLDPDEIHPVILPRQSRFTTLVIEEAHRRTLHGGTQITLAHTRQKYWIIGGRNTVRAYILRCVVCTRHRGRQAQQLMGQLPRARVSPSRPFLHTGVDYAGPLQILKWRPTNAQPMSVHIAVFVCFSTSAVHLELVTRQSTEAFVGAYKRFTGRRGIPAVMYSDNATTFAGASAFLDALYHQQSIENQQVQAALATNGTQWSFSPPKAPHFGGKWEAAVKSVKHHLHRTLGSTTFTYEELNSIIIQIEACLNSRPITPMSDDPDDLQALTPGHFLIGEPLQVMPEASCIDENPTKLQRWTLVTQKVQQFWSRWSKECLQRYQAIYKWKHREENIKVGDMVLKVDESYPPAKWPLARVIATHTGPDGLTRVATIKTSNVEVPTRPDGSPNIERVRATSSIFTRPVTKLCLLPVDSPAAEVPPEINDNQD